MKVVCFSEIRWEYLTTRKQHVIRRFPKDWDVLFFSTVVGGAARSFRARRDGRVTHMSVPVLKNFPQRGMQRLVANPVVRFLWNAVVWMWVSVAMRVHGFGGRDRVFYASNIYYARVLPRLGRRAMLYDCNDDPVAFPDSPAWASAYFERLARDADAVAAASAGLVERLRDAGVSDARLIPNGVDVAAFDAAAARGPAPEIARLPRPVVGYVGAIAEWFDFDLVDRMARELAPASVVLVGPAVGTVEGKLRRLVEAHDNVHYLGERDYADLGSFVTGMDVCTIPLRITPLRRVASRPNKLYEYAAVGKPIVTRRFSADMDPLADLLYISSDHDEFIANCRRAIDSGADGDALRAFARENDWSRTAESMVELIRDTAAPPAL